MNEKIFFCDIDNTVANINIALESRGINTDIYPANVPTEVWEDLDIYKNALPITPIIRMVKDLSKDYKIVFLTARPNELFDITYFWLEKWGLPNHSILHTNGRDKGQFVKIFELTEKVIGFIEDSPQEIESIIAAKKDIVLYVPDWTYNKHIKVGKRIRVQTGKLHFLSSSPLKQQLVI
ncbi:MAG: hypothetical protein ACH0QD_05350 [Tepidibacillus sp.]